MVEGKDDCGVVIGLMRHHVPWPAREDEWPDYIEVGNSAEEILAPGFVPVKLKESGLETLGIMFDADDKFAARWNRIRSLCLAMFPKIPADLPGGGLIIENDDAQRLGVWLMPNCASAGMLETFLRFLVPNEAEPLWAHARTSFAVAKASGCSCRDAHTDKAHIHTWLAWRDPPGERLGIAITKKILYPESVTAQPFVRWFRQLYGL